MIIKKIKINRGFVVLFAIVVTSILLAIALGVSNIALKEQKFSTSAKDTNEAFFAADTGAECALYYDQSSIDMFKTNGSNFSIDCVDQSIDVTPTDSGMDHVFKWEFILRNLGYFNTGCAKVFIEKSTDVNDTVVLSTKIISRGYNMADTSCTALPNSVERVLELNY